MESIFDWFGLLIAQLIEIPILILLSAYCVFNWTYTDVADYTWVILIPATICYLRKFSCQAGYPENFLAASRIWAWASTILGPVVAYLSLFAMANRVRTLTGHWPQLFIDDPQGWKQRDHIFRMDYLYMCHAYAFAAWCGVSIMCLFFIYGRYWKKSDRMLMPIVSLLLLCCFVMEPLQLFSWYLD